MARITSLEVENMYRIKAVSLRFSIDKGVFIIGGRNEQGKSSTIDSLWSVLKGKAVLKKEPVRAGAEEGRARVTLDNGLVVTRRVRPGGWTDLVVESTDGATFKSPQTLLGKLFGEYLDPVELARMNDKELQKMLERLAGVDYTELDQRRTEAYSDRTVVNKECKRFQAQVQGMPFHEDSPEDPISVSRLLEELEKRREHNGQIEDAEESIKETTDEIAAVKLRLAELEAELEELEKERKALGKPSDTASLMQAIEDAEGINRQVEENRARKNLLAAAAEKKAEAEKLSAEIKAIDAQKAEMLADAKLPVEGLTFGDDGVLYRGVPIEQESTSSRLKIFTPMLIAMLPPADQGVRLLFIREGNCLDDDNLKLIGDLAEAENVQVIMERVTTDPARCSVIIEDGMVAEEGSA